MILPYLKLISKRNFALLWSSQITSQFGDKLTQVALIAVVGFFFRDTSSLGLAVMFSMSIIPVILFSPVTGVYADRWDKRKTMYFCDFLRSILILLIPLFFLRPGYFPVICIIVFVSSALGRFFIPSKMAFIPQIAEKNEIFIANTIVAVTAITAAMFGVGAGGIIVDGLGLKPAFYLDAFTFFASATFIFFINQKNGKHFSADDIVGLGRDVVQNIRKSFLKEFAEGARYILSTHETKYAFRTFLFLFSYAGALSTVYIRFIQDALGVSAEQVKEIGFVILAMGAGAFLGSLVYGRLAHKAPVKSVINCSTLLSSLFLIFFVAWIKHSPLIWEAVGLSFFLGVLLSPVFIGVNSLIHHTSEKAFLGRIFGSIESIGHFGFLAAMFITSFLADRIALFSPFIIIVLVSVIGSILSALFLISDVKNRRV